MRSNPSTPFYLLSICCLFTLYIHAQPAISRSAYRLMGSPQPLLTDSALGGAALPVWFPVVGSAGQFRFGVVNRYGIGALTEVVGGVQLPAGLGAVRLDFSSLGDALYRASALQVGLSRKLAASWYIGADLGLMHVRVAGYGSRWTPRTSLAVAGAFDPRTWVGLLWENPQALIGSKGSINYATPRIRLGWVRRISDRVDGLAGMDWERGSGPGTFLQLVYRPVRGWSFDLGWGRSPDQVCLGVQRLVLGGVMRTAFSQDPVLGGSFLCSYARSWPAKKSSR